MGGGGVTSALSHNARLFQNQCHHRDGPGHDNQLTIQGGMATLLASLGVGVAGTKSERSAGILIQSCHNLVSVL
jgi:hypothetical protein